MPKRIVRNKSGVEREGISMNVKVSMLNDFLAAMVKRGIRLKQTAFDEALQDWINKPQTTSVKIFTEEVPQSGQTSGTLHHIPTNVEDEFLGKCLVLKGKPWFVALVEDIGGQDVGAGTSVPSEGDSSGEGRLTEAERGMAEIEEATAEALRDSKEPRRSQRDNSGDRSRSVGENGADDKKAG